MSKPELTQNIQVLAISSLSGQGPLNVGEGVEQAPAGEQKGQLPHWLKRWESDPSRTGAALADISLVAVSQVWKAGGSCKAGKQLGVF